MVLYMICPSEVSSERFLSRGERGDTEEGHVKRLEVFQQQVLPFVESSRSKDIVKEVAIYSQTEELGVKP